MSQENRVERSMSLVGATGVGIGAIVGGGILALTGVAFAETGPSAILAFALNGVIAIITALSFAELATRFPESGGTYTFSRKVLSVEAAFTVGWVVWFASIVAAVLYALGFAAFFIMAVESVWPGETGPPVWLASRWMVLGLAAAATLAYTGVLSLRSGGGGAIINIAKLATFAILIVAGLWAVMNKEPGEIKSNMAPFLAKGWPGLITAMGFTFIAMQGFDLIAAVGGEVRDPKRNIPRAMLLSLGVAVAIYLPLLFIIATAGVEGSGSITTDSEANPETIVAIAVQRYLGTFGYWLVIVAAVLSMLSALQANLFAASRVAFAMARDRTMPSRFGRTRGPRSLPVAAVLASAGAILLVLIFVPDVRSAGATASLIFLVSFALTHWMSILARQRGEGRPGLFKVPLFPLFPLVGAIACISLAIFQGINVPNAGLIALGWICIGVIMYLILFARRARVVDASSEAFDPNLLRLRGRSPLVLVPVVNPANAESMVAVANAMAPPIVGRVLLLTVIPPPNAESMEEDPVSLLQGQIVLREALAASFTRSLQPEALITIAADPLPEIVRVARVHRCQSLLLGLAQLDENFDASPLEDLMGRVGGNVAILKAPSGWKVKTVESVLVPVGGGNQHDTFRARLLGSLQRTGDRRIKFLQLVTESTDDRELTTARRALKRLARDEVRGDFEVEVRRTSDVISEVTREAAEVDLVILGLPRRSRGARFFGNIALRIARETNTAILMLSRRG